MRIAFTLAESERSGGVSEHTSPLISIVDFGNLFARCQYNLPTVYSEKLELKFDGPFEVMQYLQNIGENNALIERRKEVLRGPLYGAVGLYDNLFRDEEGQVPATFEFIHFLGWKYHESQQKPKKRGSADFSLKTLKEEIEETSEGGGSKTTYGELEVSSDSDNEAETTTEGKKPKKSTENTEKVPSSPFDPEKKNEPK